MTGHKIATWPPSPNQSRALGHWSRLCCKIFSLLSFEPKETNNSQKLGRKPELPPRPLEEERLAVLPTGQAGVRLQGAEGREAKGLPVHTGSQHTGVGHSGYELTLGLEAKLRFATLRLSSSAINAITSKYGTWYTEPLPKCT